MSIKRIFGSIRKRLWGKNLPTEKELSLLCACTESTTSPALLFKTITLKTSIHGEFSAAYHGLDSNKIRGYTVLLDIGALVLPDSNYPYARYEAWVTKGSVVLKVDPDLDMTHDSTAHFVISYVS